MSASGFELTKAEQNLLLSQEWSEVAKPMFEKFIGYVGMKATNCDTELAEVYRLQGEARRLKLLMSLDAVVKAGIAEKKEKANGNA